MVKVASVGGVCALLVCLLIAVTTARNDGSLNRLRRTTFPPLIPQWRCDGDFSSDFQSYDVSCNTNLDVISTTCTLDGEPYNCGGLQFSVDLSNDDGSLHVLILNARARYGSGFASLRYNFTFQRQIRIPFSVECSAVLDRGNVVVTCLGAENSQQIVSLQYSINGGTLRTAASVSMFTIDQRYFVDGWNNITLIVTGESGESRDFILRFQSSPVQPTFLNVNCSAESDGQYVVVTCLSVGTTEQITSIEYSINGGTTRRVTSLSSIRIDRNNLVDGLNIVIFTVTGQSGLSRTFRLNLHKSPSLACPSLSNIANGVVVVSGTTVNSTATYSCNAGFSLQGIGLRLCESTGQWSGEVPSCEVVRCPVLSAPTNGLVFASSRTPDSQASYSCNSGYVLQGSATRVCLDGGVWSGQAPQCVVVRCPNPSPLLNGRVSVSDLTVGSTATYTCNSGFSRSGVSTRTCQSNGLWSSQAPTCVVVRCPNPSPLLNGQVSVSNLTVGSTATYTCNSGFSQNGVSTRTCQSNGLWSSQAPTCVAIVCPDLNAPNNGIVYVSGNTPSSIATYVCNSGFILEGLHALEGLHTRVCLSNGQWSGETPTCRGIICPNLNAPTNGQVYVSGNTPSFNATYACNSGYVLEGLQTRTCLSDGQWSGQAPICSVPLLSLQCESQTNSSGISISCTSNRLQSELTLQCYLDGVLQSTCDLTNFFEYSELSEGQHNYTIEAADVHGQRVKSEISFENTVRVFCQGSLNLGSDTYSVTCSSGSDANFNPILWVSYTLCVLDGQVVPCSNPLELDISSLQTGRHTLEITGDDGFGNTVNATTHFNIPEPIGSCDIESNPYNDVVDWTCTTNQDNIHLVCLVDGVPLEDCICVPQSEFLLARYPVGSHRLDIILNSNDGFSETFSHHFEVEPPRTSSFQQVEPLEFECTSVPTEFGLNVSCTSNRDSSELNLECYLDYDDVPQALCGMDNVLHYADLSQGEHNYTVIARDQHGLVGRSEAHFEEDLHLSCHGSYSPSSGVVHLDCDSNAPLLNTECELDNGEVIQCPTPFDVPVRQFVDGLFSLRVNATDVFGNNDVQELEFNTC